MALRSPPPPAPSAPAAPPAVAWLDDPEATSPDLAGAKAANLAAAARRGMPVLPGFVLLTTASTRPLGPATLDALRAALEELERRVGPTPLVVRSSSSAEDSATSSMAGQFTSVVGAEGWDGLRAAIETVLESAAHPHSGAPGGRPMAVIVQPLLEPVCAGVLFGVDPLTGDPGHVVVEAVPGRPDVLVGGTALAAHLTLSRGGRLIGRSSSDARRLLGRHRRRRLARLAAHAASTFGGPQDIEWAVDSAERLWLLQCRPVTATGRAGPGSGPILGPGPVAETFPDPLRPLEVDLWVEPLRAGVGLALQTTGAVSHRRLAESPIVDVVGGRVAADLELFGIAPTARGRFAVLNPKTGARRLLAAWRVGRLRAVLPSLAADLVEQVDRELVAARHPTELSDAELVDLLGACPAALVTLHAHEVLAGMLLPGVGDRSSVASVALAALARGRAGGLTDPELVARSPVVLALVPPSLAHPVALPAWRGGALATSSVAGLGPREALRLRCRWVQELAGRAAMEAAARLAAGGRLARPELVAELHLAELVEAVAGGPLPQGLDDRADHAAGPPLPPTFRVDPRTGEPQAVAPAGGEQTGLPASAGRAMGVVCHDPDHLPATGAVVLVVASLDPRLAATLPTLAGIVAETGSSLSHLAILAREAGVPAVVAVPDARRRFPAGATVVVDGSTGAVEVVAA